MAESILVLDDEKEIADLVEVFLTKEGYRVYKFYDAKGALECAEKEALDLAILDVMLPDMSGFQVCARLREKYIFPIIMLTAKVEDQDKINGLSLGADDYITKPFNPLELVARVKSQLRRYKRYNQADKEPSNIHDFSGLTIDKGKRRVVLNEKELNLTPIEFDILWYLCENRGKVVSSEELFEAVWGELFLDNNNTVMAHIARLRDKMGEPRRKPKFIKTVWGVGYTID